MTNFSAIGGTWKIDPAHSAFRFTVRHAMVTKVRGHFGDIDGEIVIDGDNPNNSTVSARAQAASVDTGVKARDEHLATSDFFEAEKYPELSFVSREVKVDDDTVTVTGDLTIKDVTKSVTVDLDWEGPAKDQTGAERLGFEGSFSINRSDYGVNFNAKLETGGVLISEKIAITLDISAVRA